MKRDKTRKVINLLITAEYCQKKTCIQISTENEIKNNPLYKVGRQKVPETIRILTQFIRMYDEIFLNMYIIIK